MTEPNVVGFLTKNEKQYFDPNSIELTPESRLKAVAAERAVIECYTALFKSILRHGGSHPALAHLSDATREELEKYYITEEKREMDYRFVTIHPGKAAFSSVLTKLKSRILTKIYVGDSAYVVEGRGTDNPHIHLLFRKTTDVLDKSRILREWSTVFEIPRTCIDVQVVSSSKAHLTRIRDYMSKEQPFTLCGKIPGFESRRVEEVDSDAPLPIKIKKRTKKLQ